MAHFRAFIDPPQSGRRTLTRLSATKMVAGVDSWGNGVEVTAIRQTEKDKTFTNIYQIRVTSGSKSYGGKAINKSGLVAQIIIKNGEVHIENIDPT